MKDYDRLGYRDDLLSRMAELRAGLKMRQVGSVKALTSSEMAPDAGSQQADELTPQAIHAFGDKVDINWWLPMVLPDDELTYIYAAILRTIGGIKFLYVGGTFTRIGGVAAVNVARFRFDTRQWEAIDDGTLNGNVQCMAFDSADHLYIGGSFTNASGVAAADYVAELSGGAWVAVGGGVNALVSALAIDGADTVYIGGTFTNAGGDAAADRIAKLSGGAWVNVGGGVNSQVSVIAFDPAGTVYIGGAFADAGGDADADYIAKLSGGAWVHVAAGLNDTVLAIVFDGAGQLYVGGVFADVGGDSTLDGLVMLVDGAWAHVGDFGGFAQVLALAISSDGKLYAGGWQVGTAVPGAGNIAVYEGTHWAPLSSLGAAIDGGTEVLSIAVDANGDVYAAGDFFTCGNLQSKDLAVCAKTVAAAVDLLAGLLEVYQARADAKYIQQGGAASVSTLYASGAARLDAGLTVTNGNVRSGTQALNDDTVFSFTPVQPSGAILLFLGNSAQYYAWVFYNTVVPNATAYVLGTAMAVTTGALTNGAGDGTDTKFNISCHTDGKIYLKNRLGSPISVRYTLF